MGEPSAQQNKGPDFLAVSLLSTILAALIVILRVYVRIRIKRAYGWDDSMIILSTVFAIIASAFNVLKVNAGFGQHMRYLSPHQRVETLEWLWLSTPFSLLSLAASKVSISVSLLRVLSQTAAKHRRWFLYFIIAQTTIIAVPAVGYAIGQCQPTKKLWDHSVSGYCYNPSIFTKVAYAHGAVNAFCDFALALFPISFIKDLNLEIRKRVALGILMSCGIVCGALAVARAILTRSLLSQEDYTYRIVETAILLLIEVNVSIIVACIPTLRPLVKIFRHQINTGHSNHGWTRNRSVEPEEMNLGIDKPFPLQPVTGAAHTGALRTPPQPTTHPIEWSYSSKTNLVEGTRKAMEFAVYKNESHR